MSVFYPPLTHHPPLEKQGASPSIFLAGSIEMGKATDWQALAIERLSPHFPAIYNPRRADWDASWVQSAKHREFSDQVRWELLHIERADFVLFHFEAGTMSPVTLLELGLASQRKPAHRVFVSSSEGFWRHGNIEIVCEQYGLKLFGTLEETLEALTRQVG